MGRKTVSKEQKMRDVRYRVVVCTEFSDLSIFSFSDAYSFDISARVHVASKYIQTTDLQRRGCGDGEQTYLETLLLKILIWFLKCLKTLFQVAVNVTNDFLNASGTPKSAGRLLNCWTSNHTATE